MKAKNIEVPHLKEILHYDENTGLFTWKVNMNGRSTKCCAGSRAGTKQNTGYVQISIGNVRYSAHRLAWVYIHGSIDQNLIIDHINRVRNDNRIDNLRLVTHSVNNSNRELNKNSVSKHSGVIWNKSKSKWQVSIRINGRKFSCGNFSSLENAISARRDAYQRNYQKNCL